MGVLWLGYPRSYMRSLFGGGSCGGWRQESPIRAILAGSHWNRFVQSWRAFTGLPFAGGVMERIDATVQVVKRNELHSFVVLPKRWIVERSFAWLEKCRRLWKNCERKLNASLQMVHLAFLRLLLRRS